MKKAKAIQTLTNDYTISDSDWNENRMEILEQLQGMMQAEFDEMMDEIDEFIKSIGKELGYEKSVHLD